MSTNVTYKQLESYFEILRPSKRIFDFELSSKGGLIIEKTVFDTENPERRYIFYSDKVPMTGSELAFFKKVEEDSTFPNLPKWWRSGDTLRFAHTVKFDMNKTKQVRCGANRVANYGILSVCARSKGYEVESRNTGFRRKWQHLCLRKVQR